MTKASIRIEGIGKIRKIFKDSKKDAKSSSVDVGYTANYALPVHEMVGANFKAPGTQAKFLEQPLRELQPNLKTKLQSLFDRRLNLKQALVMIGLKLQRDSQKICPIDTGNLRASAFTRDSSPINPEQ